MEIKLGSKVKDKVTGFTGVAVSRTEFLNGCIQYGVTGEIKKDGKYPEEVMVDIGSLEIIKEKKVKVERKSIGGATRVGIKFKGF